MSNCPSCTLPVDSGAKFCPSCGTKISASADGGDALIGRTLNDKYRVLERIGAGSMGTVYLGEHIGLQKKVALKVLRPDVEVSEETLQRFQREGIAAGKFNHPNAIQIFDFDRADTRIFYLAMEFVEGSNLKAFLRDEGKLAMPAALDVVRQVLGALSEAHRHGIVHRDLKPENIMVLPDAMGDLSVKVLDFGLSKLVHFPLGASLQTQPGRIMGTPLYMAPEQGSGGQVDHRTDLYAAGLILYEMVTGEPPFQGETMTELFVKQATATVPALSESHPDLKVPGILDEVFAIALAKKPEDRFQSAPEMLEALEEVDLEGGDSERARRSSGRLLRSGARRRPPAAKAGPEPEAAAKSHGPARARNLVGLLMLVVFAGLAWQFKGSAAEGRAVPRISMKAAEDRTEEETRYVGLLEDARRGVRAGEADVAFLNVEEALSLDCRDSEAFFVRALVYRERDDDDTALAEFQEALVEDPTYAAAAAGIGWIQLDRGDLDSALASFDEALGFDEGCAYAIAGRGAVHHLRRQHTEALAALTRAIALDSSCAEASYYLGLALMEENDVDGAVRALVQAKRSEPRSGRVYAALGHAYILQLRPEDAEKQFREAVSLEPNESEPLVNLAAMLVDGERYSETVNLLEGPIERHPDWGRVQILQATALEAEDRTSEAIVMLEKALKTEVEDAEAMTLLGILYQREGRTQDAMDQYNAAIQAGGDPSLPRLNMGLALFGLERFEEARVEFETALAFDSGLSRAHYALGILHMDYLGNEAAALEHFTAYRGLGGDDARVEAWMASLSKQ